MVLGYHRGASGVYGEGYGEYYSVLLDLAVHTVPLLELTQQREWLAVLARGSYNPGSKFADWLAGHGDLIIEGLIEQTTNAETEPNLANAYAVLAQMVGLSAFRPQNTQPYLHALSLANRQRALKAVEEGLNHQNGVVARDVIWALRKTPSDEVLNILQTFLDNARGRPGFSTKDVAGRSLQDETEAAIIRVQASLGRR